MIINPTVFTGWNSVYRGPINHIAIARDIVGSPVRSDLHLSVSEDGETFYPSSPTGDLRLARRGVGAYGAFEASATIKVGGRHLMVGRLWDNNNDSRCAIFSSVDLVQWDRVPTSIDGSIGSSGFRGFVDIATNSSYVVALSSTGERAVSTDGGETFTGYGNVGFVGAAPPAKSIAASSSGFVAVGISGQLFSVIGDPRGSWTSRTSRFGSKDIATVVAGNVFCAVGANGVASTSPLTDLVSWTLRSTGTTTFLSDLFYGDGKWFASGSGTWLTSADAISGWSVPANRPGGDDFSVARSGYFDGETWRIHWGNGRLSVGDGTSWTDIENPGLAPFPYVASLAR